MHFFFYYYYYNYSVYYNNYILLAAAAASQKAIKVQENTGTERGERERAVNERKNERTIRAAVAAAALHKIWSLSVCPFVFRRRRHTDRGERERERESERFFFFFFFF